MPLPLLIAFQLAAGVPADPSAFDLRTFDLRTAITGKPCAAATSDEIVVCAARSERYRLRELSASRFDAKPLVAATRIGNASAGIDTEQKMFPGGIPSNRVMLTLKLPF